MKSFIKIFLLIFIPVFILLVIFLQYSRQTMLNVAEKEIIREIKNKAVILSYFKFKENFDPEIHKKLKEISSKTNLRITLIKNNGKVIDDSYLNYQEIEKLENHRFRPEVIKALTSKTHEGYSIRFSNTIKTYMIYFAQKYNDNLILRISYPLNYLKNLQKFFYEETIKTFLVLILIMLVIAAILAKKISTPVKKLEKLAENIENNRENIVFPEFKDSAFKRIGEAVFKIYSSMKEKHNQLIIEQEKLNQIFTMLDEGIILFDKENNILKFNSKAEKILKTKLKANKNIFYLVGKNFLALNLLEILKINSDCKIKKETDGKVFEITQKIVGNEKLLVFYDITEKQKYTEFKHQLIGNISHELKTPIATIMGYSETLIDNEKIDKKTQKKFLKIIYKNSLRMNEIINDIIELHKLENFKGNLNEIDEISIEEIKKDILENFKNSPKKIIFNHTASKVRILYQHLFSVLVNLIDNAIKYSKGKNVFVFIDKTEKGLIIKVEDEGPVIPQTQRERIFERFYTISKSRSERHSGTGLGLSIVKHISKIYSGDVKVYPNKRNGNTFEVIFTKI